MKAVISVIGKDKVGILAMIANECANYNLNVLDVTQTIVDSMFTMTMMVAIDEMSIPLNEFAEKMVEAGYYVIGHDHLGHGDSVNSMEELGHLGEDGAVLWLKDMELVRRMAVAAAPNLPYIMLGHSMGSFLARRYLIYHGERIDGAVLIGTGQQPFLMVKLGLLTVWAGKLLKGGMPEADL